MDKYCENCKVNELLTVLEKQNQICDVCKGKQIDA